MEKKNIIDAIKDHTVISLESGKLDVLFNLSEIVQATEVEGCVVEVGVYLGGTAKLFALSNPKRHIHLFDTFQGIPYDKGPHDKHFRGNFAAKEEDVRKYLSDCNNVSFYTGIFPETWPEEGLGKIAIAHCDVDMMRSAIDFIDVLWPYMSPYGFMIFDDYNAPACPGVKIAVNEFMEKNMLKPYMLHSTQCIIRR